MYLWKKLLYLAKTLIVHRYQNNVWPKHNKIFLSTHINQIYRICSGFKTSYFLLILCVELKKQNQLTSYE